MKIVECFLLISVVGLLGCQSSYERVAPQAKLSHDSLGNGISISDSLAQVLVQFRSFGSIVIRGNCTDAGFINDEVSPAPIGKFSSVQDALAEWSHTVPRLLIHQDAKGMWRISDNTASPSLLNVEIKDLHTRVFNGAEAIGVVLGSKEVQLFFRDNAVGQATTMGGLAPYDGSSLPRSEWHLHGATVADAFDDAVTKYAGVWVYTECVTDHRKLITVRATSF